MDFRTYDPSIQKLRKEYDELVGRLDPRALRVLYKIRREAIALNDDLLLGNTYHCLAFVEFFITGRYNAFLRYIRLSARCLLRCGNTTEMAYVYFLIAMDAMNKGAYDIAYNFFLQGHNDFEAAGDENLKAIRDLSIGHILQQLDDYRHARTFIQRALRVIRKNKNHPHYYTNVVSCHISNSSCCLGLGLIPQAEQAYHIAEEFFANHPDRFQISSQFDFEILGARLFHAKNDHASVRKHLKTLVMMMEKLSLTSGHMEGLRRLCESLIDKRELRMADELLTALRKTEFAKNTLSGMSILSDMQVSYAMARKKTDLLQEAYQAQHEVHQQLIREQKRVYQYTGELLHLVSELRSEQETMQKEHEVLLRLAKTDTLTGLANREALTDRLEQAFENAWQKKSMLGICMIDIDELKKVNDIYGHAEGDRLLEEFGTVLADYAADIGAFAGRYGGDEFVVIYENKTDAAIRAGARRLAKRSPLRISQGICNVVPTDFVRPWDLLKLADSAMYAAKKRARVDVSASGISFNNRIRIPEWPARGACADKFSKDERIKAYKEYVSNAKKCLNLTSPRLDDISSGEEYRLCLEQSFYKIGELGKANNIILEKHLFPILASDYKLTEEDIDDIKEFSTLLADMIVMENTDPMLVYLQAEKILERARSDGDLRSLIIALDNMIVSTYMMVNITIRLYPDEDICFKYRDKGLEAGYELLEYLEPEKFKALPDNHCRELVLITSRYIRCLFDWNDKEDYEYYNDHDLRLMRCALAIAEDPFYRELAPDYNWDGHIFRTLHYLADFTERNNFHRFNREQLAELYDYTKRMVEFIEIHPEFEQGCPKLEQRLYMERISYLNGKISRKEYQQVLLDIIKQQGNKKFVAREMYVTIITPLEYLLSVDSENITPEEAESLVDIYDKLVEYAFRMPKTGVLSFMLTFIHNILRDYIVVPGGLSLKDMCLEIMAAMHPTTYVHTLNVAAITRYLALNLIDRNPELLIGVCNTKNADEVIQNKEKIAEFAYDGALLHDIGKVFIVETIITYWRNLIESEWELLRAHTIAGASLLRRFPDTSEFAELALGHHKWFDDSKGYPEEFRMSDAKYPALVSLLSVADCLDAATDSIGRTYKKGKSLDEVSQELKADSGTRYAPYAVELIQDPVIKEELNRLLTEGRNDNYRNTYTLLKSLSLDNEHI